MFIAVALAFVVAEILSCAAEAKLTAAYIQRTFFPWLGGVLAAFSGGTTLTETPVAAIFGSVPESGVSLLLSYTSFAKMLSHRTYPQ